jgi:acyl-coenzyme A synthetase/AMP-(fatty) acid ligase
VRKASPKTLKAKAWRLFSEYIRRAYADRYGNAECYTCGAVAHWKEHQAGHAIPGRHNSVLLDEDVVRVQCVACNIFRRGNYPVFVTKLIKEHSASWFEQKLADARKTVTMRRSDWETACEYWKGKLEQLEGA